MKADAIFTNKQIINQNITIVFDNLDIQSIKIDQLKSIGGKDVAITMLPDLLIMIIPATGLIIQLGDRRLRVTSQIPSSGIINIWSITKSIKDLLPVNISAYGFNFDLLLDLNENHPTMDYRFLFSNDLPALEGIIESKIDRFNPRFAFMHNGALIDLILDPINPISSKMHGNIHYENNNFPNEDELNQSFTNQLNYILDLSNKLFAQNQ